MGKLTLETHGGQRPDEVLQELEALAALSNDDIVAVNVMQRPFATLSGMSPPSAAAVLEVVARALTEWESLSDARLLMPPLEGLRRDTIREIEQARLALRGEAPTEDWRELSVKITDPVQATESFSRAPDNGILMITCEAAFDLGNGTLRLPRVLTKTFTGAVTPSPNALKRLKKGDRLKIRGNKEAKATWGVLRDPEGNPVTEQPADSAGV